MYTRNLPKQNVDTNELIDISSDDDDEAPPVSVTMTKATNGPSTSQKNQPNSTHGPAENSKGAPEREKPKGSSNDRGKKRKMDNQISSSTKKKKSSNVAQETQEVPITFENVAGMDKVLREVADLLMHVKNPEIYRQNGIPAPRGFLLHGPPGCGKTMLANAIAGVRLSCNRVVN